MADRTKGIEPPGLAALVDLAERPRAENWSLRAALTRYAQPQPMKVSHFLESVRRIEGELDRHLDALRTRGPALWERLTTGDASTADGDDATLLGVLAAAQRIDEVGDRLATWAVRREGERPDAAVDEVSAEVAARLDELGIPREERLPPSARPPARRRR